MKVKVKDEKTGRHVMFELTASKVAKYGQPIGVEVAANDWVIDNGLSPDGYQWEPVGEVEEFSAEKSAGTAAITDSDIRFILDDDE